eukprot:g9440.t2
MAEQSCSKHGEVEVTAAVPTASLVIDGGGHTHVWGVPLAGTHHEDGTPRAHAPHVRQMAGVEGPTRSRRRRPAKVFGVFFILTAVTQAILAGIIRAQGIKIMDRIEAFRSLFYPTAGNPWIGILTFFVAVVFLYKIGFANDRFCLGCYELSILVVLVISFGWSFFERAVYNGLQQFDECIDKTEDLNGSDWTGACYCWSYGGGSVTANVDISDRMSCDRVLDYVDSVLVSYLLMIVLVALMVMAIAVDCSLMPAPDVRDNTTPKAMTERRSSSKPGEIELPTATAGVEGPSRSRRRRFILFSGTLIFMTMALAQAVLAGIIRAQGIKIMDRMWVGTLDNLFPTAGNPYIGILALFFAVFCLYIAGLKSNDRRCSVGCELWLPFSIVIFAFIFGWSLCERAVYRRLHQFDECIDKTDELNGSDWTGDCYCWSYGGGSVTANVKIADRMSCDRVLGYVDSVLVSYVLMTIVLASSVVPLMYCCRLRSAIPSSTGVAGTSTVYQYVLLHATGAGAESPPTNV